MRVLSKTIKDLMLLLISFSVCLSLVSCAFESSEESGNGSSVSNEPKHDSDEGIMVFNRFNSIGEPPFSLQGATETSTSGYYYSCNGATRENYDSFLAELGAAGFSLYSSKYSDFLFRDDCMVFSRYCVNDGYYSTSQDDAFFGVSWYQRSPFAPQDGISYEEAAAILMPDRENSLSKIPIHPIDITPEGFFERTGGQLFVVPVYSYDVFKSEGRETLMFEDNEHYSSDLYYVNGTEKYLTSLERVAVCDIDNDGSDDVLLLSWGGTSGLFTFVVTCITDHGVYESLFNTEPYRKLIFSDKNGVLVVEGIGRDESHDYLGIQLEETNGRKIVELREDDERLPGYVPIG